MITTLIHFFSGSMSSPTAKKPLYILDGQSIAVGTEDVSNLSSPLTGVIPYSYIHFGGSFQELETGVNQCGYGKNIPPDDSVNTSNHGAEVNFMYLLGQYFQRNNYLLKLGQRATGLAQNPSEPDHNVNSANQLHQDFLDKLALIDLDEYQIKGLIWEQGQDDAIVEAYADEYETNQTAKINAQRTACLNPSLPMIIDLINLNNLPPNWTHTSTVNTAKQNVVTTINTAQGNSNLVIYDPTKPEVPISGGHPTSAGYNQMGLDWFNIAKNWG